MYETFGDRRACIVREITKIHEEAVWFRLKDGYGGEQRGECILVVEGAPEEQAEGTPRERVIAYMQEGCDKKEALKRAAKDFGIPKSDIYRDTLDL